MLHSLYSFADVYDRHLEKLSISKIAAPTTAAPSAKKNDKSKSPIECKISFEQLLNLSDYVAFLLTSQALPAHDSVLSQLKKLLRKLNASTELGSSESFSSDGGTKRKNSKLSRLLQKNSGSPSSLRRLLFGGSKTDKNGNNNEDTNADVHQKCKLSVVLLSLDSDMQSYYQTVRDCEGCWLFPADALIARNALLRVCAVQQAGPSLVLVDSSSRCVVNTDAKRALADDPDAEHFPWLDLSSWAKLSCWSSHNKLRGSLCNLTSHYYSSNGLDEATINMPAILTCESTACRNLPESVNASASLQCLYPLQPSEVFHGSVSNPSTSRSVELSSFKPTVRGLLFAANWCSPCRSFVRQLLALYHNVRNAGHDFEIIYCSSDRSQESYDQFVSSMPWLTLPFGDDKVKQLTRAYNVHGIPSLVLIDADDRVITKHGKDAVCGDMKGREFPWPRKSIHELTEYTLCLIKDEPTLVIFTEGTEEDIAFSVALLRSVVATVGGGTAAAGVHKTNRLSAILENDENGNAADASEPSPVKLDESSSGEKASTESSSVLQCMFTGPDVICDQMLLALGFEPECELPVAVIVDALAAQLYVSQHATVSVPIVSQFMRDFMFDRLLPTRQLDASLSALGRVSNRASVSVVGGIPLDAVNNAIVQKQLDAKLMAAVSG